MGIKGLSHSQGFYDLVYRDPAEHHVLAHHTGTLCPSLLKLINIDEIADIPCEKYFRAAGFSLCAAKLENMEYWYAVLALAEMKIKRSPEAEI